MRKEEQLLENFKLHSDQITRKYIQMAAFRV